MSFFIKLARNIFKKEFERDEDFKRSYQANIAMLLHDRYGITGFKERNDAANDIMKVIFDAENKNIKEKIEYRNIIKNRFEILDLWIKRILNNILEIL